MGYIETQQGERLDGTPLRLITIWDILKPPSGAQHMKMKYCLITIWDILKLDSTGLWRLPTLFNNNMGYIETSNHYNI